VDDTVAQPLGARPRARRKARLGRSARSELRNAPSASAISESASLTNRVALLEEQGAIVAARLERLDLIDARLDLEPVVVDANGKQVGTSVVSLESTRPSVMFEMQGLPCVSKSEPRRDPAVCLDST
jgi:hypothetical protein